MLTHAPIYRTDKCNISQVINEHIYKSNEIKYNTYLQHLWETSLIYIALL